MIIPIIIASITLVIYIVFCGAMLGKAIDRRKKLKKAYNKLSKRKVNRDLKRLNELLNLYNN